MNALRPTLLPFLAAAVLLLAGCTEPPAVPDDAAEARDDALPGLVLRAWTEARGAGRDGDGSGSIVLRGVLENGGDGFYDHRSECGHPWHSTLADAQGRTVHARLVEPCQDFFYERLAPGHHLEFRHTWDLHDHGAPDAPNGTQAATAGGAEPVRVAAGTYTWTLVATVIGPRAGELQIVLPIEVAPAPTPAPTDAPAAPSTPARVQDDPSTDPSTDPSAAPSATPSPSAS